MLNVFEKMRSCVQLNEDDGNFVSSRKRATEEFRKKEDDKHRREVEERLRKTTLHSSKSKSDHDKSRREPPRK